MLNLLVEFTVELWQTIGKDVAIAICVQTAMAFADTPVLDRFLTFMLGLMEDTDADDRPVFDVVQYIIDDDHNCRPRCEDERLDGKRCLE